MYLDYRSLLTSLGLDFDEDVHQRNRGRSDPGNAGSVPRVRGRTRTSILLDLAGKAADGTVIEPLGNGVLLGFLEALDGALLLQKVAFVLDFGFDGLQFVAGSEEMLGHGFRADFHGSVFWRKNLG
jgi:hypothetical protein